MPVPKTPEQTSPVSPLLQYQETGTTAAAPSHWTLNHGAATIPTSYSYPDYAAPAQDQEEDSRYPGYYAYEEPAPLSSYTPAAYEEEARSRSPTPTPTPADADRSYEISGAYQYDGREKTGSEQHQGGYAWVDLSRDYDEEEGIDEKLPYEYEYKYDQQQQQRLRFGAPPEGPTRRRGTKLKKKVVLTDGNLVVDLPIPSNLRLGCMQNVMDEMCSVR